MAVVGAGTDERLMTDGSNADEQTVVFDTDSGTYRTRCDDYAAISTTVVLAVAAARDEDASVMPPLNAVIDPDALNALFAPQLDGSTRGDGRIEFTYADCTVTVDSDGQISVAPP